MKVLITGATGLIGKEIVKLCHAKGIVVHYLTTRKGQIVQQENYKGFYWNPARGEVDVSCFEGVEAIINLAGASVAKRWTKSYKKEILNSRIQSLHVLKKGLESIESHSVKKLVSASAIGIYPSSLTNYYEEHTQVVDTTFLGNVVYQWEQAADSIKELGIGVVKIRIGVVLAKGGGALKQMATPVKYGLGAPLGSGEQWQSWIHIQDIARLFMYAIENGLQGVYNGVAPNPINNKKLTKEIASVLRKPLFLPNIPKIILKILMGTMAQIVYSSQRVSSKKIEEAGFSFQYKNVRSALEDLLK
ncbi:TIGR01777 family oxidoreductase [Leptobacterium sp. I13]|uniref:TIGR01777 family oxidoreductase n=1 Tax=Leptobacterium meishanense TaxID=3128904 RepID=UPI0030ED45DC